jgi:hypothetical protein
MAHLVLHRSRAPWIARAAVKVIAAISGVLTICCVLIFVTMLRLTSRGWLWTPVALVLLIPAIAVAIIGAPFWSIAAICGVWLHAKEGIYATIEPEGIRVESPDKPTHPLIPWDAVLAVREIAHPLARAHEVSLRDGTTVRIDFVDADDLAAHLAQRGVPLSQKWWNEKARETLD